MARSNTVLLSLASLSVYSVRFDSSRDRDQLFSFRIGVGQVVLIIFMFMIIVIVVLPDHEG